MVISQIAKIYAVREAVESLSLEILKTWLIKGLSNLIYTQYCTCFEQDIELVDLPGSLIIQMIPWFCLCISESFDTWRITTTKKSYMHDRYGKKMDLTKTLNK